MKITETKLRRMIRNVISEYGRRRSQERKQHWVIVCDWTKSPDTSLHRYGEAVFAEYFGTKADAQRQARVYSKEEGVPMWIESSAEDRL